MANACGLSVPSNGLLFPSAAIDQIPNVTRPQAEGGVLERKGMVEVINALDAQARPIDYEIRMGVWVTVEGETEYIRNCFEEYKAKTDDSGRYFTLYKRWHLIGLEVGMSVASVALRGEPTGVATGWNADVVATAKRDLRAGDTLDGEGGYTVYGKLMPAADSRRLGGLPLGLAHGIRLVRPVAAGQPVKKRPRHALARTGTATGGFRLQPEGCGRRRIALEDGWLPALAGRLRLSNKLCTSASNLTRIGPRTADRGPRTHVALRLPSLR